MPSRNHTRYDDVIATIADYACSPLPPAPDPPRLTLEAWTCLKDAIGCAFAALPVRECRAVMQLNGSSAVQGDAARVPGLPERMPIAQAAGAITTAIRWLDFNDTWLAQEWGHPSDNIGAILAVADAMANNPREDMPVYSVGDILEWTTKAYEIQGILALENSFNRVGIDHVLLVKVASAAVAAAMISNCDADVAAAAISHAWLDASLRTYRHFPNTGSRKSWAAGDAVERSVKLAMLANAGVDGCHTALTAPEWGFQDAWFGGDEVALPMPLATHVVKNILYKVRYPAEFHGQTAVEAAIQLHPQVKSRLDDIAFVSIQTQEAAMRIIDKTGPLQNEADRDHCIQYMTAVALIRGDLATDDYSDEAAQDPRIDRLRENTIVEENPDYSRDYLDPSKRAIANSVQVAFNDRSQSEAVEVQYPLGHPQRRKEARQALEEKFHRNLRASGLSASFVDRVAGGFGELEADLHEAAYSTSINDLMALLQPANAEVPESASD